MKHFFVTGANRGLGLEIVRQLVDSGFHVTAACRQPDEADELQQLSQDHQVRVLALDVRDDDAIAALPGQIDTPIDGLINNAGVYGPRHQHQSPASEEWLTVFHVNSVAPYKIATALKDSLSDDAIVATVTSRMGSIGDNTSGGSPVYRASKAAVNAAMKSLAVDWEDSARTVLLLHPGWVETDMGGENALIQPAESISGMLTVILNADHTHNGQFLSYEGEPIVW